jgi:hypothetical protein
MAEIVLDGLQKTMTAKRYELFSIPERKGKEFHPYVPGTALL